MPMLNHSLGGSLLNADTTNGDGGVFLGSRGRRMYRIVNSRRIGAWNRASLRRLCGAREAWRWGRLVGLVYVAWHSGRINSVIAVHLLFDLESC
jgi:hypothetical protein